MAKMRQEMIDELVTDWAASAWTEGPEAIEDILRHGCVGYDNLTDERLLKEYNDAFGDRE